MLDKNKFLNKEYQSKVILKRDKSILEYNV